MPLVPFHELMAAAERGSYAVGYFETWDMDSMLAVADAAEATRSPVLLGWSGIYLTHPSRVVNAPLGAYAAFGLEVCRGLRVPSALIFNESPNWEAAQQAVRQGYGLVMYSDERVDAETQIERVRDLVWQAHEADVAVEGEATVLAGVGGELAEIAADAHLTDVDVARDFVARTGIDALAVAVGQMHLHGRQEVRLDRARLADLRAALQVPLVLHGATSVRRGDLSAAIELGVRKINVGSALKQAALQALRQACAELDEPYNPYEAAGSGLENDVQVPARLAVQRTVEELMVLFGSAGQA